MNETKRNLDEIKGYWTRQAETYGPSYVASWSDRCVIEMEIEQILRRMEENTKIIDIGCANGFSTLRFAKEKNIDIHGVDYIPEMIRGAHKNHEAVKEGLLGKVSFGTGDICNLDVPSNTFDQAIVIRVIINLENWENQKWALNEVCRVVRPGGTFLLSEATVQGWRKMNKFRNEWGLSDIPVPSFNFYLDEELVVQALMDQAELVEIVNFSSSYFVGTRVIKPLICKLTGREENIANPDLEWNKWFSQMPAIGDYGTQKLFIFRKK